MATMVLRDQWQADAAGYRASLEGMRIRPDRRDAARIEQLRQWLSEIDDLEADYQLHH